jgi:hypothetical protein
MEVRGPVAWCTQWMVSLCSPQQKVFEQAHCRRTILYPNCNNSPPKNAQNATHYIQNIYNIGYREAHGMGRLAGTKFPANSLGRHDIESIFLCCARPLFAVVLALPKQTTSWKREAMLDRQA